MNPNEVFCPNLACPARGQIGKGNIGIHSQKDQRYICQECHQTFTTTKGTIFYRLRTDPERVMQVLMLLANGCPAQAIVQAFGLDERTIRDWWQRAGQHCQGLHEYKVGQAQLDLQQVQADEIRVKSVLGIVWMALGIMVSTRLWLGGAVSLHRDQNLLLNLANQIRNMALCRPILLAVDGFGAYIGAFRKAFRTLLPPHRGETGRPQLVPWPNIAIVQMIKTRVSGTLHISRNIVQGSETMVNALIQKTQGAGVINTAFIERINATFRQRLNPLARKTRTLAHKIETLQAGMFVVGCFYNFCHPHHSLRQKLSVGRLGYTWVPRTPALAAGLTDHIWLPADLFSFHVPPPRWQPQIRRGPLSALTKQRMARWCS